MEKRIYAISMYTPIGVRQGMMSAVLKQDKITGTIEILGHTSSYAGTVEADGNCKIEGSIISLMKTIEYIAIGKITKDDICLKLQGKRDTFRISGVAWAKEGDRKDE